MNTLSKHFNKLVRKLSEADQLLFLGYLILIVARQNGKLLEAVEMLEAFAEANYERN